MKKLLILISINFASCLAPHSRFYEPLDWEKPLFEKANKAILPSDIIRDSTKYYEQFIHWFGVIDTFWTESRENNIVMSYIIADHKYYDYIEDFGLQNERIFLSELGEGKFLFVQQRDDLSIDSSNALLSSIIPKGTLGVFYGLSRNLWMGLPTIQSYGLRIIPKGVYTTKVFKYNVKRDSTGNVVLNNKGIPELKDFQVLKYAEPGSNQ